MAGTPSAPESQGGLTQQQENIWFPWTWLKFLLLNVASFRFDKNNEAED